MTDLATVEDRPLAEVPAAQGVSPLVQMFASGQYTPEQIGQMIDLQAKYDAHEAKKSYDSAMARFRSEVDTVKKDSKGHNSNYASLAAVVNTVSSPLSNNGFNYSWKDVQDHEKSLLTTTCTVTHEMGHSESTSLTAGYETSGNKNDIQSIASAKSYLNRYTLLGLLGLATEDDDGQSAGKQPVDLMTLDQATVLLETAKLVGKSYYEKWKAHYIGKYGEDDMLTIAIPARFYNGILAETKKRLKKVNDNDND